MTDIPEGPNEAEPDVRFTYANERTFLAWNRTALALIAAGIAGSQLLPSLQLAWGRRAIALLLIGLGVMASAHSFRNWRANERAMRRGEPLPRAVMPLVLGGGIVLVGVLAGVIAALGTGEAR